MDRLISRFDAVEDGDLMLVPDRGIAYAKNMKITAEYDAAYFDKYSAYEGSPVSDALNGFRVGFVAEHAGAGRRCLDIGIGCGEFIKRRPRTFGFDVNQKAAEWLKSRQLWREDFGAFDCFTFWDVIEHIDDPHIYFRQIPDASYLFASLPTFVDLGEVRASKHYRPGEHLYYFTRQGFIDWMKAYRFELLDVQDYETEAGREAITSFAFRKIAPGYTETVAQYHKLYAPFYGASAWLYFNAIAREVLALGPSSILDYGCGRSDLVAHFWNDGKRRIAKYDPAIPAFKEMPEDVFDLVLAIDVMEHIPFADVARVLDEIRAKSRNALFVISLKPARTVLPDGRNAHVTLLSESEWLRWISEIFGKAELVSIDVPRQLMVKTF